MMITPPRLIAVLINLISSLTQGLLGLRIILKLFGASTTAPFVRWAYETTQPLLAPFIGMFPSPKLPDGFIIEFSALFALMIYSFIGYLATELLDTLIYYSNQRVSKQ
jgi:uncharacterized protein YggT (Ycf19 family)